MVFKICTIGCGRLASECHGPSYARYAAKHPGVELTACCDLDEAKAVKFRDRFGFTRHYTDVQEMLYKEKPAAVCVIVPEHDTCDLCCKIIEMGYPVMMEKPPGRTIEELDRMIAIADTHGVPTQVAFNRRHVPLARKLKGFFNSKFDAGRIHHISYDFSRIARTDEDFSATIIHCFDTIRYLTGFDFQHVKFRYQDLPALGPTVLNIFADGFLESGSTVGVSFCPYTGIMIERITVYMPDRTIFLKLPMWNGMDAPGRLLCVRDGQIEFDISGGDSLKSHDPIYLEGFYGENESFFNDIRNGHKPADDLQSTRQTVIITEYIQTRKEEYVSFNTKKSSLRSVK